MAEHLLHGRVAIITGGGNPRGMGYAMAVALVQAGARVALLDRDASGLEQSVAQIRSMGGADSAMPLVADVTEPEAVERAVQQVITELGGLHILVNNAGILPLTNGSLMGDFWEKTPEVWNRVLAVNVRGPFHMARAVVGHLIEQGWGRIIGVTTSIDTMWLKGNTPYGPSKAAHEAFVAAIAQELEGTGVTANVLVPGGMTITGMTSEITGVEAAKLLPPEVMQAPAVWLASDDSNTFTGQRIIARLWDESMPLEERLAYASAPAAWPQLGQQAVQLEE